MALFLCSASNAQDSARGGSGGSSDAGAVSTSQAGGSSSAGSSVGLIVGQNYVLKPSDVISLEIYQETDLDKQVRIEADGTVTLALIGKVKIAQMTVAEAQALITDLYDRDFLVDPQVNVLVVSFSPKFVRVLGHVGNPGMVDIPPDKELTLIDAITQCRGVSRLGDDRKLTITRSDQGEETQAFEVNFRKIKRGEAKDFVLQEGDIIYIPERLI
ncbi:MAG: polysaccharide biosynthesis/export family protein [Coraliomargaritaceae bacterium]